MPLRFSMPDWLFRHFYCFRLFFVIFADADYFIFADFIFADYFHFLFCRLPFLLLRYFIIIIIITAITPLVWWLIAAAAFHFSSAAAFLPLFYWVFHFIFAFSSHLICCHYFRWLFSPRFLIFLSLIIFMPIDADARCCFRSIFLPFFALWYAFAVLPTPFAADAKDFFADFSLACRCAYYCLIAFAAAADIAAAFFFHCYAAGFHAFRRCLLAISFSLPIAAFMPLFFFSPHFLRWCYWCLRCFSLFSSAFADAIDDYASAALIFLLFTRLRWYLRHYAITLPLSYFHKQLLCCHAYLLPFSVFTLMVAALMPLTFSLHFYWHTLLLFDFRCQIFFAICWLFRCWLCFHFRFLRLFSPLILHTLISLMLRHFLYFISLPCFHFFAITLMLRFADFLRHAIFFWYYAMMLLLIFARCCSLISLIMLLCAPLLWLLLFSSLPLRLITRHFFVSFSLFHDFLRFWWCCFATLISLVDVAFVDISLMLMVFAAVDWCFRHYYCLFRRYYFAIATRFHFSLLLISLLMPFHFAAFVVAAMALMPLWYYWCCLCHDDAMLPAAIWCLCRIIDAAVIRDKGAAFADAAITPWYAAATMPFFAIIDADTICFSSLALLPYCWLMPLFAVSLLLLLFSPFSIWLPLILRWCHAALYFCLPFATDAAMIDCPFSPASSSSHFSLSMPFREAWWCRRYADGAACRRRCFRLCFLSICRHAMLIRCHATRWLAFDAAFSDKRHLMLPDDFHYFDISCCCFLSLLLISMFFFAFFMLIFAADAIFLRRRSSLMLCRFFSIRFRHAYFAIDFRCFAAAWLMLPLIIFAACR